MEEEYDDEYGEITADIKLGWEVLFEEISAKAFGRMPLASNVQSRAGAIQITSQEEMQRFVNMVNNLKNNRWQSFKSKISCF